MSAACYLFIPFTAHLKATEAEISAVSWVVDDSVNNPRLVQGSLSDLANAANQYPVVAVLPGEYVTFLTTTIPGNNRQRVRQALPYALEDFVIDDVEQLHFSIADEVVDGTYRVAVINKRYLQFIINTLKSADINPVAIIADYMLLENNNVLFVGGDRALFSSPDLKFATAKDSFKKQQNTIFPADLELSVIYSQKDSADDEVQLSNSIVKSEHCAGNEFICLIKHRSTQDNLINLLQGQFKKKRNWSQARKQWQPVAALFLLWISIKGGMFLLDYINLSKQNEQLNNEIVNIYKNTFPDSTRIIDAHAQMKQKLEALKKRKGQQGRGFSELLTGSSEVLSKFKGLKIKSLRFFDGRINLELQISNLQDLDTLKKQLNDDKGYQVEIQSASSEKDYVSAHLQITGAVI